MLFKHILDFFNVCISPFLFGYILNALSIGKKEYYLTLKFLEKVIFIVFPSLTIFYFKINYNILFF